MTTRSCRLRFLSFCAVTHSILDDQERLML